MTTAPGVLAHKRYDRFFSLSLDLLCIAGFDGYFKELNPSWERILGWAAGELTGRPFVEFVHPEDQQATIAEAERLGQGGVTISFENRYRCKDGSYRRLEWTASSSADEQVILAVARDVTAQRSAEEERARNIERERSLASEIRLLLESTADGIYGIDVEGRCTFVNRAARELLGFEEGDLLGQNMHNLIHHSRPDGTPYPVEQCPIFRTMRSGSGARLSSEALWRRNGTFFFADYSSVPIVQNDEVRGAVVTFTDITARKVAQECVVAERNRLGAVLSSMVDGAVITDPEGKVVSINPAMEQLGGRPESTVKGALFPDAFPAVHENGTPVADDERFLLKAIRSRMPVTSRDVHISIVRADESRVPVAISAAPILDGKGELLGGVAVLRDVTYEREVDELKSSLISTVSHELRTPLTMIQGFSELLLSRRLDEQQSGEALKEIHDASQRLSRLIDDLLSVSRIESGRLAPRLRPLMLDGALHDAIVPFARSREISLTVDEDMPLVLADRDQLLQIITNLVSNAIKYSPEGTPVSVTAKRHGDRAELSVTDRGMGLTRQEIQKLFGKFVRSDRPEVRNIPGNGLGLYITKRLVEMQQSEILVESEPGKGSTFRFTLPIVADLKEST